MQRRVKRNEGPTHELWSVLSVPCPNTPLLHPAVTDTWTGASSGPGSLLGAVVGEMDQQAARCEARYTVGTLLLTLQVSFPLHGDPPSPWEYFLFMQVFASLQESSLFTVILHFPHKFSPLHRVLHSPRWSPLLHSSSLPWWSSPLYHLLSCENQVHGMHGHHMKGTLTEAAVPLHIP